MVLYSTSQFIALATLSRAPAGDHVMSHATRMDTHERLGCPLKPFPAAVALVVDQGISRRAESMVSVSVTDSGKHDG